MDPVRFDTLTKTLSTPETRRGALGGLLAGTLSLLGLVDGAAKKRSKATAEGPCGDGSGKANACKKDKDCCTRFCRRGRCRCKKVGEGCRKDRNCCASFSQPLTCVNQTCQMVQAVQTSLPPGPTCTDGIQNQGESDIDCGGPCPRCVTGQTCASGDDCASAFCCTGGPTPGTCRLPTFPPTACTAHDQCCSRCCVGGVCTFGLFCGPT